MGGGVGSFSGASATSRVINTTTGSIIHPKGLIMAKMSSCLMSYSFIISARERSEFTDMIRR